MLTQQQSEEVRQLRSHYDKEKLLGNGLVLHNALGDILGEDDQKLRTQIRLAMDAGLGKLYLELGDAMPSADFDRKVKMLLEEECGLSSSTATDVQTFFDELAGVPSHPASVAPPIPVVPPEPVVPPKPVISSAANTTSVSLKPVASWIKLYFWAVLPFIVNVAYSLIDRLTTGWFIDKLSDYILLMTVPGSSTDIYWGILRNRWGELIIPLVLPYVLPVLVWLIIELARRGQESSRAAILASRYGTICAIAALVLGNILMPTYGSEWPTFLKYLWNHYVMLIFYFGESLFEIPLICFQLPYIILSLVLPALSVLLIYKRSRTW